MNEDNGGNYIIQMIKDYDWEHPLKKVMSVHKVGKNFIVIWLKKLKKNIRSLRSNAKTYFALEN